MRFSSLFQQPAPPAPGALPVRAPQPQDAPEPQVAPQLPDELDVRVRLVGEWQLLEG